MSSKSVQQLAACRLPQAGSPVFGASHHSGPVRAEPGAGDDPGVIGEPGTDLACRRVNQPRLGPLPGPHDSQGEVSG